MEGQIRTLRMKMLGALLREARRSSGKSLRETARLAGIRPATLASYEAGRKAASLPELEILSYRLKLPLERLWSGSSPAPSAGTEFDPGTLLSLRHHMLGALLRAHRREASLSIRQVSEKVAIPASRLSAYERGERAIPLPDLLTLAEAFGKSIEEYLDTAGPIGSWGSSQRAVAALQQLPPDVRAFVANPANGRYLELAKKLSELSAERMRELAEELRELST